jgi:hypothetical protein
MLVMTVTRPWCSTVRGACEKDVVVDEVQVCQPISRGTADFQQCSTLIALASDNILQNREVK